VLCPHRHPTVEQELQLHLGVLQQHAALMIGGATATPCPICHKVVFGGEALVEHMKNTHKDPNASGVASKFRIRNFKSNVQKKNVVYGSLSFFTSVSQTSFASSRSIFNTFELTPANEIYYYKVRHWKLVKFGVHKITETTKHFVIKHFARSFQLARSHEGCWFFKIQR
jgi:hypothetical protein